MQLGVWKSFDELEDNLCLNELEELVRGIRATEYRKFQADAAIAGIEIDDDKEDDDPVKQRIKERIRSEREAAGVDVEKEDFASLGITMVRE